MVFVFAFTADRQENGQNHASASPTNQTSQTGTGAQNVNKNNKNYSNSMSDTSEPISEFDSTVPASMNLGITGTTTTVSPSSQHHHTNRSGNDVMNDDGSCSSHNAPVTSNHCGQSAGVDYAIQATSENHFTSDQSTNTELTNSNTSPLQLDNDIVNNPNNPTERSGCGGGGDKKSSQPSLTPEDFKLLQVIGVGSFGKVFLVEKKDTHKIYAMKVLKKEQVLKRKQVAHTQTERRVLEQIEHPFIVPLRFAFQTDDKLYMVLDYFNGGELFFHLKANGRFSEDLARFYAAEIILALECLHQHSIVYRDLKPENILLDADGHIRLTDFGLSKQIVAENQLTHTFCGTPEYLAPEMISGEGYNQVVDWWSLGTLLYEMLTGLPPFFSTNTSVMYEKIMNAELKFPSHVSPEAKDLLTKLLVRDPSKRIGSSGVGAEEIRTHPFFKTMDWKALFSKQLEPPFKPSIQDGELDTNNIDDEFKKQRVNDTPVLQSQLKQRVNFPDFSYAAPESNGLQNESALPK